MNRQLSLTPTEVPVFQALAVGESMWIVREGVQRSWEFGDGSDPRATVPPVEFVQACAPCVSCEGSRCDLDMCHDCGNEYEEPCARHRGHGSAICDGECCSVCRIELVGPCPTCEGQGVVFCADDDDIGDACDGKCVGAGTVTLGYAYAVGEPLPIIRGWARPDGDSSGDVLSFWLGHYGPTCVMQRAWNATVIQTQYADRIASLAHYGPPESLVGRYALELGRA